MTQCLKLVRELRDTLKTTYELSPEGRAFLQRMDNAIQAEESGQTMGISAEALPPSSLVLLAGYFRHDFYENTWTHTESQAPGNIPLYLVINCANSSPTSMSEYPTNQRLDEIAADNTGGSVYYDFSRQGYYNAVRTALKESLLGKLTAEGEPVPPVFLPKNAIVDVFGPKG